MSFFVMGAGAALSIGGSLIKNKQNKDKNRRLQITQQNAQKAQLAAQEKYNKDFGAYQNNMRSLLDNTPELTSNKDAMLPYLNQVRGDLMASQGRAAGSEVRRDDIRQNSADQIYRASRASRTGSDLMGAIGRIQAGESALTRELGGREAQERVSRIDDKTTALQNAVKSNSIFNVNDKNRIEAANRAQYGAMYDFERNSQFNLLGTNLNFASGNIDQQVAIGTQQANGMVNGLGDALTGLGSVGLQYGMQNQQIKSDAKKYGVSNDEKRFNLPSISLPWQNKTEEDND